MTLSRGRRTLAIVLAITLVGFAGVAVVAGSSIMEADRVSGRVLFNGSFDRGLREYSQVIHGSRIALRDDPLGLPRKAARFTVYDWDIGPTENPRAQISSPSILRPGADVWFGWSTLFPSNFPRRMTSGSLTIESTYGPPHRGTGPRSISVQPSASGEPELRWQRNDTYDWDVVWRMPLIRGRWIDFVVHQKMSRRESEGFVEMWVNTGQGWVQQRLKGRRRLNTATIDASNGRGPNDHRLASYRTRGIWEVVTLWHAAHKVGTSFAAVAPNSYGSDTPDL